MNYDDNNTYVTYSDNTKISINTNLLPMNDSFMPINCIDNDPSTVFITNKPPDISNLFEARILENNDNITGFRIITGIPILTIKEDKCGSDVVTDGDTSNEITITYPMTSLDGYVKYKFVNENNWIRPKEQKFHNGEILINCIDRSINKKLDKICIRFSKRMDTELAIYSIEFVKRLVTKTLQPILLSPIESSLSETVEQAIVINLDKDQKD